MIQHLEILHYRSHRYTSVSTAPLQVFTGPSGSGKSTLIDALRLLSDMVALGLDDAVEKRTDTFEDLVWARRPGRLELAIECALPEDLKARFGDTGYTIARYEIAVGREAETERPGVLAEKLLLMERSRRPEDDPQQSLFHLDGTVPDTILTGRGLRGTKTVVHKLPGSNDKFYDETGDGWDLSFRLGPSRLALAGLPEDEDRFPVSRWLRHRLTESVHSVAPDIDAIRRPLPPGRHQPVELAADASNMAAVVERMQESLLGDLDEWVSRLQAVEPNLLGIAVVQRPIDYARILVLRFEGGIDVPAGSAPDGLLRLLALTLPLHTPASEGLRLIESPESGLHPRAFPLVAETLTSPRYRQVFFTTYSPGLLEHLNRDSVLSFTRDPSGASVVRHPDRSESLL